MHRRFLLVVLSKFKVDQSEEYTFPNYEISIYSGILLIKAHELSSVNRSAFQDTWIKLLLEPKKFTGLSFVLFLKHGRHAEREKNEHKPRK